MQDITTFGFTQLPLDIHGLILSGVHEKTLIMTSLACREMRAISVTCRLTETFAALLASPAERKWIGIDFPTIRETVTNILPHFRNITGLCLLPTPRRFDAAVFDGHAFQTALAALPGLRELKSPLELLVCPSKSIILNSLQRLATWTYETTRGSSPHCIVDAPNLTALNVRNTIDEGPVINMNDFPRIADLSIFQPNTDELQMIKQCHQLTQLTLSRLDWKILDLSDLASTFQKVKTLNIKNTSVLSNDIAQMLDDACSQHLELRQFVLVQSKSAPPSYETLAMVSRHVTEILCLKLRLRPHCANAEYSLYPFSATLKTLILLRCTVGNPKRKIPFTLPHLRKLSLRRCVMHLTHPSTTDDNKFPSLDELKVDYMTLLSSSNLEEWLQNSSPSKLSRVYPNDIADLDSLIIDTRRLKTLKIELLSESDHKRREIMLRMSGIPIPPTIKEIRLKSYDLFGDDMPQMITLLEHWTHHTAAQKITIPRISGGSILNYCLFMDDNPHLKTLISGTGTLTFRESSHRALIIERSLDGHHSTSFYFPDDPDPKEGKYPTKQIIKRRGNEITAT